jgi:DNA-binding MarR family transcriptional regulator
VQRLAERRTAEIVLLDDALRFMRVLWNLQHALQSSSKRMERAVGVTGPQRLALRVVGTLPGITPAELARVLHLDPSTITGVVRRLSDRKLITREADPSDRRLSRLRLSAGGARLLRPSRGTVEAVIRASLKRFPRAKIRASAELLEELSAALTDSIW